MGDTTYKFTLPDIDSPEAKARIRESKLNKYEQLKPYMMDYWYPLVSHLSFPATFIPFPSEDFVHVFDGEVNDGVKAFVKEIDGHVKGKTFAKTANRSPKDSSYPSAPYITKGDDALYLFGGSMRMLDDVVDMCDIDKPFYLVLRPWMDIPQRYEFRCFVKDGALKGITQYFYDKTFAGLEAEKVDIQLKIESFHKELADAYPVKDYVFDVFLDGGKVILIEINPYGLSDPCLFEGYQDIEENGGFRIKP